MEYCYDLTDENEVWMVRDREDVTIHHDACVHLHRIYTKMAIMALEDGDADTSVDYYLKAYNAAREGGGRKLFNEACLQVGFAYERNNEPDTALLVRTALILQSFLYF